MVDFTFLANPAKFVDQASQGVSSPIKRIFYTDLVAGVTTYKFNNLFPNVNSRYQVKGYISTSGLHDINFRAVCGNVAITAASAHYYTYHALHSSTMTGSASTSTAWLGYSTSRTRGTLLNIDVFSTRKTNNTYSCAVLIEQAAMYSTSYSHIFTKGFLDTAYMPSDMTGLEIQVNATTVNNVTDTIMQPFLEVWEYSA